MDLGMAGKHAVVCGGSKGISYAAAWRFAKEGASLTLVARTPETLDKAAETLRAETGAAVDYVACDLTTEDGRAAVLAARPDTDILLTNSGVPQRFADFQSMSREDWTWWFEAHFFYAVEMIKGYLPGMKARRFGRIVNVSVNFIKFPQARAGHSHAARLALAGVIASLVREVAPYNVTINSVLPGPYDTEALRAAIAETAQKLKTTPEDITARMVKNCPAGRIADPQEAGDLIAMLASAQMGFVTGQNITNDGGAYQGLF